ncbi:hypothetical protein DFH06DRAFT_1308842 [Mycena polygramma]|nr:hypothetical protein DFH06DRAFT_1308842 [Mycena polygramma]
MGSCCMLGRVPSGDPVHTADTIYELLQRRFGAHQVFVAGLALATWLKAIQSVSMLWLQNITMYTNEDAPSIWVTNWCSVMASAAIGFYVQMFFCYRLGLSSGQAIGRNFYLVLTTVTLFVVALSAAGVATYFKWTLNYKPSSLDWYAGYLGDGMCGDLCLTGGIVFSLLHHRQVVLPRGQTAKMVDALLRLRCGPPCIK